MPDLTNITYQRNLSKDKMIQNLSYRSRRLNWEGGSATIKNTLNATKMSIMKPAVKAQAKSKIVTVLAIYIYILILTPYPTCIRALRCVRCGRCGRSANACVRCNKILTFNSYYKILFNFLNNLNYVFIKL